MVGDYVADRVVERRLVLELKCVERLAAVHLAQCLDNHRATRLELCLLMNFQNPRLEWRRVVLDRPGRVATDNTGINTDGKAEKMVEAPWGSRGHV